MEEKLYTLAEVKEIACKFAEWHVEENIDSDNDDEEIYDISGFPIEMNFDKFVKLEL